MAEKLLITGLALIAAVWLVGELKDTPLDGARKAVGATPVQQAGPNYLPAPKLPDPVDDRGLIDPRDFRAKLPLEKSHIAWPGPLPTIYRAGQLSRPVVCLACTRAPRE